MDAIKQLFENAGLPTDFGDKAKVVFEATLNEAVEARLKEEMAKVQEAAEKQLTEDKEAWIAEQSAVLDTLLNSTLAEWATENAAALNATINSEIAEGVMSHLRAALESQGIALADGQKDIVESAQAKVTQTEAEVATLKESLATAEAELLGYKKAEIIAEATDGLTDVSADRVAKLAESLAFKDLESFTASVKVLAEAFGSKVAEGKGDGKDDKGADGDNDGDDKGVDNVAKGDGDGKDDKDNKDDGKNVSESFDPVAAAVQFLTKGKQSA